MPPAMASGLITLGFSGATRGGRLPSTVSPLSSTRSVALAVVAAVALTAVAAVALTAGLTVLVICAAGGGASGGSFVGTTVAGIVGSVAGWLGDTGIQGGLVAGWLGSTGGGVPGSRGSAVT